jgi:hypothetical protein
MPQLAIETFVSQYFWFIVILLAFYFITITQVIPRISEIMKTRKKCASYVSEASYIKINISNNNTNDIMKVWKNVSLTNKNPDSLTINSNNIELTKATESWVKKNI